MSSELVYQNPWIRVREDKVIRPDGAPGIYGVVETKIATGVVALDADLQIYLVGQYRYPTERYSWEIVQGGTDPGETPLEAAKRELKEEAGIQADEWQELGGDIQISNCITAEIGRLYLARGLKNGCSSPEGTEVLQIKKVPLTTAAEMVFKGQITDAMSVIGIMFAANVIGLQS